VSVAITEFWYKFSNVRPVLEVTYVDMFGPHKSEKNFLDCTQSTKIIGEMLKNGGCVWLPSTESFTIKHRPAAKTQLVSRELIETRHREDVELRTICHAVRITLEKKLPFVVLGTHEEDVQSFADAECFTNLIKLHQEVIVKRYRRITLVYHGVTHPGPKCEATLHGIQRDKIAIAIKWSLATVRHAIANRKTRRSSMTSFKRSGQWSQTLAKVARNQMYGRKAGIHFEDKTVDVRDDPIEHESYIGGLRRTARSVSKLPSVMVAGGKLGNALDQYLQEQPQVVKFITQLLHDGTEVAHDGNERSACSNLCRKCELERITMSATEVFMDVTGAENADAVDDKKGLSTALKPGLFRAWRRMASDPDTEVEKWLEKGGPCGILATPVNTGVFAPAPEAEAPSDPFEILMEELDLSRTKIDHDQDAYEQLENYVAKGYVYKFASVAEAEMFVGGKLVLSDLVIIEKQKPDGKLKRRVILNCLSSGVSKSSMKTEKAVLPRVMDVVFDTLEICAEEPRCEPDEDVDVEFWVADIVDAYWNVPIEPKERRFFCCKLRGHIYIFLRATQGSRGGPLLWARTKAMSARCAQATCSVRTTRINVYVDDPIIVTRGSAEYRRCTITKVLLVWIVLRFAIAWAEAQHGLKVVWTSAKFEMTKMQVVIAIKPELLQHSYNDVCGFLRINVITAKRLRTLVGRATHVASIIVFWIPFVSQYGRR